MLWTNWVARLSKPANSGFSRIPWVSKWRELLKKTPKVNLWLPHAGTHVCPHIPTHLNMYACTTYTNTRAAGENSVPISSHPHYSTLLRQPLIHFCLYSGHFFTNPCKVSLPSGFVLFVIFSRLVCVSASFLPIEGGIASHCMHLSYFIYPCSSGWTLNGSHFVVIWITLLRTFSYKLYTYI